jgi:hypothetical protein
MALPRQQQNNLDRDLRNHEARLKHPRCSQEEAAVHQMLLTLGRSRSVQDTLDALYDNPELAREMAQDSAAFLKKRGVATPQGVSIAMVEPDPSLTTVEVRFAQGHYAFKITWNRNTGFTFSPME